MSSSVCIDSTHVPVQAKVHSQKYSRKLHSKMMCSFCLSFCLSVFMGEKGIPRCGFVFYRCLLECLYLSGRMYLSSADASLSCCSRLNLEAVFLPASLALILDRSMVGQGEALSFGLLPLVLRVCLPKKYLGLQTLMDSYSVARETERRVPALQWGAQRQSFALFGTQSHDKQTKRQWCVF
ncbi:hypothetical protein BDF14DRAFT_1210457 [Spinellus fusiger]|nr:hypothetical protein BDF14DRAFT_1210457 [Spinellus fusiger]